MGSGGAARLVRGGGDVANRGVLEPLGAVAGVIAGSRLSCFQARPIPFRCKVSFLVPLYAVADPAGLYLIGHLGENRPLGGHHRPLRFSPDNGAPETGAPNPQASIYPPVCGT